jgi:hypothetical protein
MRILFIGSSHTVVNGLPYQVRHMLHHGGVPGADVFSAARGGKNLGWHSRNIGTRLAITCHKWDLIVLQQQTHPFEGYDSLTEQFAALVPYLQRSSARVMFTMTWCRKGENNEQAIIDEAYLRLCRDNNLQPAPVSAAWHAVMRSRPEIELYDNDGSHARPAGTYIAACVFFAMLTGRSPEGQAARIEAGGIGLVDLKPSEAEIIQRATWEICRREAEAQHAPVRAKE